MIFFGVILLMVQKSQTTTTWDVENPCKSWDIGAGFLPSTVGLGGGFDSDMFFIDFNKKRQWL